MSKRGPFRACLVLTCGCGWLGGATLGSCAADMGMSCAYEVELGLLGGIGTANTELAQKSPCTE